MRITVLAGGVGGARFALGLREAARAEVRALGDGGAMALRLHDAVTRARQQARMDGERARVAEARAAETIKARLAEGGIAAWREALSAVEASPLCLGDNDRGWRADLDFICQPKSFAKLREGSYAPAGKPGQSPPRALAEMSPELIARRRALLEQAPETPNA
jgi:hypothetical protein